MMPDSDDYARNDDCISPTIPPRNLRIVTRYTICAPFTHAHASPDPTRAGGDSRVFPERYYPVNTLAGWEIERFRSAPLLLLGKLRTGGTRIANLEFERQI